MAQPIKSTLPEQPTGVSPAPTNRSAAIESPGSARVLEIRPREREASVRRPLDAFSTRATEAFDPLGSGLSDSYRWAARQTREGLRRASSRARHFCGEYPLHVIAAVAGTTFVIGILLRIGRSSHD
jgi:hypothetical protein